MGLLAENKSRSRINKDPNNTKWTRDTTTFGQKILRAQGWQPGQYLGVQDAAHSELYTAANASYIRVTLKDDMKGLGFNKAKEDQVTGLDVFSDLLSRLNGKSEDHIEGEKQARLEVKTHRYVEAKWGPMRFVRGGLLIGDEMKEVAVEACEDALEAVTQSQCADDRPGKSKKSKKRKAADVQDSEAESSQDAKKQEKRRRKEERRLARKSAGCGEDDVLDEESGGRRKKKSKKDKSKSSSGSEEAEEEEGEGQQQEEEGGEVYSTKKKLKKEKKDKKDKKKKKTRKREDDAETEAETEAESTTRASSSAATTTGTSTPTTMGTPAPGSRNFVRSRFIAQKRQAVLDTKALAQIFMVKT
ncbi:hypothetical protein E4U55_004906 [Claviceps digitariae]|nr:hypothetical protein E4U55_004906 [Claviceps digitariae]